MPPVPSEESFRLVLIRRREPFRRPRKFRFGLVFNVYQGNVEPVFVCSRDPVEERRCCVPVGSSNDKNDLNIFFVIEAVTAYVTTVFVLPASL